MDALKIAMLAVSLAIGLYTAYLFYNGRRRVSPGPLKEIFTALLLTSFTGILYAFWSVLLAAEIVTAQTPGMHDPLIHELPGDVLSFLFFVGMLFVAQTVEKLANQIGFSK